MLASLAYFAKLTRMNVPKPASFLAAEKAAFRYLEKSNPRTSNLDFLTYGVYELIGPVRSGVLAHPSEESLLFCWKGGVAVTVNGENGTAQVVGQASRLPDRASRPRRLPHRRDALLTGGTPAPLPEQLRESYSLETYDVLYLPRGAAYSLEHASGESKVIVCRAPAEKTHPVFHARWKEMSKDEKRIRHLKGKDVFLMFDVSEPADKLIAGYTLFRPHQRSYPPHNHTDQEEIYIFTQGRGSMEVYADEESKSFVRSVNEGDAVTIPLLNYHPVFSQEEELHFIWCIAGNRYWVGDKNKDFMTGNVDKLTT